MRAFVEHTPEVVHIEINVSEAPSKDMVSLHQIRAVPAYRLIDPSSGEVIYRQSGGSPEGDAISEKIQAWRAQHPEG